MGIVFSNHAILEINETFYYFLVATTFEIPFPDYYYINMLQYLIKFIYYIINYTLYLKEICLSGSF